MKKFAVVVLIVVALMTVAGVASAEHGNIGGISINSKGGAVLLPGTSRTMESGNIGGIYLR